MRDYVIINGVNSSTIQGLAISKLPSITKPLIRTQVEEIDGRDGDLITELGYSSYDKQLEIGLYGNFNIDAIIKYFTGEGTIIFSNEPNKYYNFKILNQIDYEKLLKFKTAVVTIHCQPFKYLVNETPVEASGGGEAVLLKNLQVNDDISNMTFLVDTTGYTYQQLTNGISGIGTGITNGLASFGTQDELNGIMVMCTDGIGIPYMLSAFGLTDIYKPDDTLFTNDLVNDHLYIWYILALYNEAHPDAPILKCYVLNDLTSGTQYGEIELSDNYILLELETGHFSQSAIWNCMKLQSSGGFGMTINNTGNIYAKPILTIEGSGDIEVNLNDIQILEIALGDNGSITIDVPNLEAYKTSDGTLLNRLVTGDYAKLIIQEGENSITFGGNVTGASITHYTRWI